MKHFWLCEGKTKKWIVSCQNAINVYTCLIQDVHSILMVCWYILHSPRNSWFPNVRLFREKIVFSLVSAISRVFGPLGLLYSLGFVTTIMFYHVSISYQQRAVGRAVWACLEIPWSVTFPRKETSSPGCWSFPSWSPTRFHPALCCKSRSLAEFQVILTTKNHTPNLEWLGAKNHRKISVSTNMTNVASFWDSVLPSAFEPWPHVNPFVFFKCNACTSGAGMHLACRSPRRWS